MWVHSCPSARIIRLWVCEKCSCMCCLSSAGVHLCHWEETLKCMWAKACWYTEDGVCVCVGGGGCDLALLPDLCPDLPLSLSLSLSFHYSLPPSLSASHGKINNASKHIKNISWGFTANKSGGCWGWRKRRSEWSGLKKKWTLWSEKPQSCWSGPEPGRHRCTDQVHCGYFSVSLGVQ